MKLVEETIDWFKKRMSDSAFMLGILIIVGAIAGANGRTVIRESTREQLEPVQRQVAEHEQKLTHQADDIHEIGKDVRELYRVLPTIGRSERLERPFPVRLTDGGEP